jgi:lipoprotein-anchoring transpeptidase ErfK/SrfK
LYVKSVIPNPNYTYTPDEGARGKKTARWIFPPGPNNPVGVAWVGLTLKGYGIHGSPFPERIGRAESHGCFRLSNWNAARLMKLCDTGVPVVVE